MKTHGLTVRQRALKQFIATRIEADGYPPTVEEMRVAMGLHSKSGIARMVDGLEERGHLARLPYRARSIRIIDAPHIDTADALRVVIQRCKMSGEAAQELARLLAAEASPPAPGKRRAG